MNKKHQMEISDDFCKKVLRIKPVMAYLLHECAEEFSQLSKEEIMDILNHENTSQVIQELNTEDIEISKARIIYDLITKVTNGKEEFLINLEPQGRLRSEYPLLKRGIYGTSRMISGQKNKPYGFQKSEFKNLKKCYSIWIVINAPEPMRGIHNLYVNSEIQMRGNHSEERKNYDLQRIVLLCLTKEIDVKDKSAVMMLSVLLSSQISRQEKVFILKEEYGIILTEEEEKEVAVMSGVWEGYYYYGVEDGMERGLAQGIALGERQGEEKRTIQHVRDLMANLNVDLETAMKLLNVSDEMKQVVVESFTDMSTQVDA